MNTFAQPMTLAFQVYSVKYEVPSNPNGAVLRTAFAPISIVLYLLYIARSVVMVQIVC